MVELWLKAVNMWKKNTCFFWIFGVLFGCEITYIITIQGTDEKLWYECINYVYVILLTLPAISLLFYVLFKRMYMPRAPKNTRGIAFYVVNANEKQYESITKKFIAPFIKAVNSEKSRYHVIQIDDYHSEKYYPILYQESEDKVNDETEQIKAKILKKRRCHAAIMIDCQNGGDGEALFCHLEMKVGLIHNPLPQPIRDMLVKDISIAFLPLREIDIMKISETPDFSNNSTSLDIIYKYILASTCFHCGDYLEALKVLESMEKRINSLMVLPSPVVPISNVLPERIATCYRVKMELQYQMYCLDGDENHLSVIRQDLLNKHCQKIYGEDNKIFEGICSFVLDGDIPYAIQCMDAINRKALILKFNKIFLMIYDKCTVNNVFRAYNLYKSFEELEPYMQDQIEAFICNEYEKNKSKKQLLFLLFLIYDQRKNNDVLANSDLERFCMAFPNIVSGQASSIFEEFSKKYKNVESKKCEGDEK